MASISLSLNPHRHFSPSTTTTTTISSFTSSTNPIRNLFQSNSTKPTILQFFTTTTTRRRISCCSLSALPRLRPEYVPNQISDPNYVRIFDTTLRDGEQSPGATMTTKEKLDIARQLAKLGVDIIEAGFPASSEADLEAVKLIAQQVSLLVAICVFR